MPCIYREQKAIRFYYFWVN